LTPFGPCCSVSTVESGGGGRISGLGYVNLDLTVKKRLVVYEKVSTEFSGVLTNVMNHLDFANPSLSLQSASNWGYEQDSR
jgi:hypothetical protein